MADFTVLFTALAIVLIGILLDKVVCSTSVPWNIKSTTVANDDGTNKGNSEILASWSKTFRDLPNENKVLLNPVSPRKEREKSKFHLNTPKSSIFNIPVLHKTAQNRRRFRPFLTFPENFGDKDEGEGLSTVASESPGTNTKTTQHLSADSSLRKTTEKDTRQYSEDSPNSRLRCTHDIYNESNSISHIDHSDHSSSDGEIEKFVQGRYPDTNPTNIHSKSNYPFRSDSNLHDLQDGNSISEQKNVKHKFKAKVDNSSAITNNTDNSQIANPSESFHVHRLQRRKPDVVNEFSSAEESFEQEAKLVVVSGDETAQTARSADVPEITSLGPDNTNIRPKRKRTIFVTRITNDTFQRFASSISDLRPQSPSHTTDNSQNDAPIADFSLEKKIIPSSHRQSDLGSSFSPKWRLRRRRRRRWGQRPRRPSGRTSPFGRSRSRDRNTPSSRTSTGSRSFSPFQPRISPDAQLVSLKVIVEVKVTRGYHRFLENAIQSGLRRHDFSPMLKFINPTGKLVRIQRDQPRDILKAFCEDILEVNTTAVFQLINPFYHTRSWSSAQYMANLLATLNIPVITWGPEYIGSTDKTKSEKMQLNISPTLYHQAQAMLDVIRYYKWSSFAVVYTEVPGHDVFLSSLRVLVKRKHTDKEDNNFGILAEVRISNTSDAGSILEDVKGLTKTDARIILLYCREGETINILHEAQKLGLVEKEYVWILTFEAINKNKAQNANNFPLGILGLQYTYREEAMKEAIETAVSLWLQGLQHSLFSTANENGAPTGLPWTAPAVQCQSPDELVWEDGKKFYNFLRNVSYGNVAFNNIGQLENTALSLYNVQPDQDDITQKKWTEVGQWTADGVKIQQITWPGGGKTPPRGKPERHYLRVVTREEPPFVIYRNLTTNGSCDAFSSPCVVYERDENETRLTNFTIMKCCTGLSIDFLQQLSSSLKFDFYLYEVEDFQWGTKTESGQWDGIVGEVKSGRADMAVASMTIDEDKSSAVNYSVPYMETGITFIVAIREGAISATAFLEPYDYPSWCLILLCSVHVTGASIFLFEWVSPYGLDYGHRMSNKYRFSLFRSFWLMWAMLFGAAVSTDSPRGVSSKFTSNIWALFALVFTASYTANLAAFMITKEEYYNLSGMQDWRLQNPYSLKPPFRFATVPNSTAEGNIKKNNPTMYSYMKQYGQLSVDQAMEALKAQRLEAFIYDASVLEYQEGKDRDCQLITVGNWYATTGYGVAFPHGSPWLHRVNNVILELQYEGEMERLKEFWLAGACHTKRKKATNSRGIGNGVSSTTLGILNFTSAFIFLAAGTGLAAVVFLMEHCLFWVGRKKLSTWDKKGCCALISLSMGMSMTFRDSVKEALEAHKKAKAIKCKNVICETRLWKANFELRQARELIDKLQLTLLNLKSRDPNGLPESSDTICIEDRVQGQDSLAEKDGAICLNNRFQDDAKDGLPEKDGAICLNNRLQSPGSKSQQMSSGDVWQKRKSGDLDDDDERDIRVTLL